MSGYGRVLRREYTGNISLKTTDHCIKTSLLAKFTPRVPEIIPQSKTLDNGQFLMELKNVFSAKECAKITKNANKCIFEDTSDKYRFGKQRNSSRLLALDKMLTKNLWSSMKSVLLEEMEKLGVSTQPLGFDVTRGVWELHGLNEAVRINKYSGETNGHFGPHKDAQFCPNGDERSILTLLIYLNDDFEGGETCFYFPTDTTLSTKGMTIKEEIDLHGGLKDGYNLVKIVPQVGHAVLSSQNILHEALPVRNGTKCILKTDVVVKRHSKEFGFAIKEREKKDYLTCLDYFREAQQKELEQKFNVASDLYEKALSIRYSYPDSLPETSETIDTSGYAQLPPKLWLHVFKFLPGYDAQNLVYAYPELNVVHAMWEQERRNVAPTLSNKKYIPKIRYQKGTLTSFEFPDAEFFQENITGCCRVAAMYSFFLLGQSPQDDVYTVKYNPDTQDVCVVALETLLTDVFFGQRCYGSFYNVEQQDPWTRDPTKDFEASVDRNYMLMRHGAEFTGVELPDSFYAKTKVYLTFGDVLSDSDDDGCDEVDDDDDADDDDDDDDDYDDYDDGGDDDDDDDDDGDDDDDDTDDGETTREMRDKGLSYDNAVPFLGKRTAVAIDSLVRYMLFTESPFEMYRGPYYMLDSITKYFQGIEEVKEPGVSAALVSKLQTPVCFPYGVICICSLGSSKRVTSNKNKIASNCSTEYFNHLVFDFQESQLKVEFLDGEKISSHSDSVATVMREITELGCAGNLINCKVNIEPVLSPDTSFNHASCQCGQPRFDLHKYYHLKQYSHLTSVAIFAKEKSGKIIVWTIYNGIVAL